MSHPALALVLALVLMGTATADPQATTTIGPDGGYWLKVTVSPPEAPHESKAPDRDDCAAGARPATTREGIQRVVDPAANAGIPFVSTGSTAPFLPRCVATPVNSCVPGVALPGAPCEPRAYLAYDVAQGRYYVILPVTLSTAPFAPNANSLDGTAITGRTGVGAEGDCESCPPPVLL